MSSNAKLHNNIEYIIIIIEQMFFGTIISEPSRPSERHVDVADVKLNHETSFPYLPGVNMNILFYYSGQCLCLITVIIF